MVSRRRRRDAEHREPPPERKEPEPIPQSEGVRLLASRLAENYEEGDRERVLALAAPLIVVGNSVRVQYPTVSDLLFQMADLALTDPETALPTVEILEARMEDVRAELRKGDDGDQD